MSSNRELDGIYKGAHKHMLTVLKYAKTAEPDLYRGAIFLAEEMRDFFVEASGGENLKPIPKD